MNEGKLSRGGRPRKDGRKTGNSNEPVFTLRDLGISKRLSIKAQKLASLSEAQMEEYIIAWKASDGRGLSLERFLGERKTAPCKTCPTCGRPIPERYERALDDTFVTEFDYGGIDSAAWVKEQTGHQQGCLMCGASLVGAHANRWCCSNACKQKMYRLRCKAKKDERSKRISEAAA